tara:strand:- start:299 stop:1618 length:1320 start_codon:yes stop_codon:yes gene_type:complete
MLKRIFLIGVGRSSSSLIKYLINLSKYEKFKLTIGDKHIKSLSTNFSLPKNFKVIEFDIFNDSLRKNIIESSDIVISMLPSNLHFIVANDCVNYNTHLITASYVDDKIKSLSEKAKKNNVIILNEIGLDPGIDHMSAMQIINNIKEKNGEITSFKSYCGGLIADEYDNNPWKYKFTWNPKNVINAGKGISKYLLDSKVETIPYNTLFNKIEKVKIYDNKIFESYINRDSLKYKDIYGISNVSTLLRGTLRKKNFCESWDLLVKIGLTDYKLKINTESLSYKEFLYSLLSIKIKSLDEYLKLKYNASEIAIDNLKWLGFLSNSPINLGIVSPGEILYSLLKNKWQLDENDKDMIVMHHEFKYLLGKKKFEVHSSFILNGEDQIYTAMSKTVGLPVGIATKLILNNKINQRGVIIPIYKNIYDPILFELKSYGINFLTKFI